LLTRRDRSSSAGSHASTVIDNVFNGAKVRSATWGRLLKKLELRCSSELELIWLACARF
jgi:hypothetical protein